MIACGDSDHQPENQSSNPLYPSGSEQVQRGQIVTGENSAVSEAEVVIIDAERLVVLARVPVDDQGSFVVSVPQRPSYWLGVSGPYMTTYIDTAFAFTGEAITVNELPKSYAAGKAAQVVGILGDVNNDNQVDIADALLVLLYTLERFSFIAPNQGNIALGDVNEDGQIDIADVLLIMTYIANPLDPTLPDGIGLATEQTAVAVAIDQDKAVLIALYEATSGNNWDDNTNWLSSTYPLDQWYGVETDDEGRVTSLDLNWNGLTGPIPEALGQLHNLQYLDLGLNDLAGEILEALVQLNNLQYLNLNYNDLTGTIPDALGQLDSLHTLYLADNDLIGTIPETLGQLNNLQVLDLSDNDLTGPIPEALGQLNNLQYLGLEGNDLTGIIPEALGQLNGLQYLGLSYNDLTGTIPGALGLLDSLHTLYLDGNELTGCIPAALQDVWLVKYHYRDFWSLPEPAPLELQDVLLGLSFCLLDDRAPLAVFYEATGGDHWTDNANWLSEVPLNEWYGVTTDDKGRVTALDLSQNELTGPIPSALSQLDSLQTLDLSYNQLTGPIPEALRQLNNLESLDLSNNQLIETIPKALAQLNSLHELRLSQNELTGPIPSALSRLDNLWVLFLGGNQLTGCIPSALQDVSSNDLEDLGLAFCLSEIRPETLALYGTLVSTFTNIVFAALVPGTTSVPGEGGGSVEISGNDWTLQDYSPDGALIANGALNIDLTQDPIPLTGTVILSGSQEAELVLDMTITIGADGLSTTGMITIDGTEFDVAEVSAAAAAAAAEAAG